MTTRENIGKYIPVLEDGQELSPEVMTEIFSVVDCVLRSEQSELEWDKAWYMLDFLRPRHRFGLPYLIDMVRNVGDQSRRDTYARIWAVRAIKKINGESSAVAVLEFLLQGKDEDLRREAAVALRNCNVQSLKSVVPSLVTVVKDKHAWIGTRCAAFLTLTKSVGLGKALSFLTTSTLAIITPT